MTREQLWEEIKRRNRTIDGQCTFKAGQVRKLFDLVWDQAVKTKSGDMPDFLKGLFGRG